MRNLFFFGAMSFLSASAVGQEVISTAGDSFSNGSAQIDFTIGEPVINTISDGITDLTQGFHQTHWDFVSVETLDPQFIAHVFPNPMVDQLTIQIQDFEQVNYTLTDARGRLVAQGKLTEITTIIDVRSTLPGSYQLVLTKTNAIVQLIQLVKHQ